MAQMSLTRSGALCPTSFPLFQGRWLSKFNTIVPEIISSVTKMLIDSNLLF
ncbi:hypothetical protein QF010_006487 [Pseudomonas silensiensis]